MDENENESRYQTKAYGVNNQHGYSTSIRLKVPARDAAAHSRVVDQYGIASNDEDVDDEETGAGAGAGAGAGKGVEKINGVRVIGKDSYDNEDEEDENVSDEDEDTEDDDAGKIYEGKVEDIGMERPQKKRKLKNLISNYEFAPRVRAPSAQVAVQSQPSSVGRDGGSSWSERETLALLDAWGERFLKANRKSLGNGEWREVAEKVSQETNIERTDTQCRNRLDTLKKKYRKEKMVSADGGGGVSKWVFFRKMDMLMCSPTDRPSSLSCGVDSGEYVFMNPKVYLNRANGLDEMRDSPENSESSRDDRDDSDCHPPRGKTKKGRTGDNASFRLLADSIQKFSEIYEDIEVNKGKQMVELETMRMDFQRQIETQRRQILERAQAEIVKIRQGCDDDNDLSVET